MLQRLHDRISFPRCVSRATAAAIAMGLVLGIASAIAAQGRVPLPMPHELDESTRTTIERLFGDRGGDRGYAALELGQQGARGAAAVPFLWHVILNDHEPLVWTTESMQSSGFGKLRDTSPAREAAQALKSIDPNWIKSAETRKRVPELSELARDGRGAARALAVDLLSDVADARALNALANALQDPDEKIRRAAARGLGRIADANAVSPLVGALRDPQFYVKWDAVEALARIRDPRAIQPLIDLWTFAVLFGGSKLARHGFAA